MLETLSIRDFIIVEKLDLDFSRGFTALTGETGAGKSILVDALSLALGARNDNAVVRQGAEKAEISVTCEVANNVFVQNWLQENEIDAADGLILRRVIYADGRSRCFINGVTSTVSQLKALGGSLVDIYSQNAHHSLLNNNTQRQILDTFANHHQLVADVATHYKRWHQLHLQAIEIDKNASAYADELAELRDRVRELTALNFSAEEWQALQAEHSRLSNSAALIVGVESSINMLNDAESAALSTMAQVQSTLTNLVSYDETLKEAVEGVDSAVIQLEEVSRTLNRYLQNAEFDPARLSEVEERIQDIYNVSRKYRLTPQQLSVALSEWQARQIELEGFASDGALATQVEAAQQIYATLAQQLSEKRKRAADILSEKISQEMQRLALSGGRFEVALNACAQTACGLEQVEFLVAGHAGVAPRPMNKVASGGELSRISLALHVTTAAQASVPCMIFDEVDVGIGGGVAEVVGQLLKQLGNNRQVLVITHLAQVAAQAAQHLQVSKAQKNAVTLSHIKQLSEEERIEEIARMSGGLEVTDATRSHAKAMLNL